jgi:hypothetical protein
VKPGLIIQDFGGRGNEDVEATRARLLQGSSWKRQRTIMVIPASNLIPAKVYLSHCNLIFPPNNGVVRMLALGMEVGDAYSQAIANILAHPELGQWEYLLTVEHDNCPPPDGVLNLIKRLEERPEFDAISGLYYTKGEGGVAQIWGSPQQDPVINYRPQPPQPGQLVEAYGLGMGFCLYRLSMFRDDRIPRPWFRTKAGADGVGTQDLAFWGEARKYGHRCAVDCACPVGHYDFDGKFGPPDTMW